MSKFKPSDFCEIVDHPRWRKGTSSRKHIGERIFLIRLKFPVNDYDMWEPRWLYVGGGKVGVSEKVLRKIPPPQLDEEESEDLELVV